MTNWLKRFVNYKFDSKLKKLLHSIFLFPVHLADDANANEIPKLPTGWVQNIIMCALQPKIAKRHSIVNARHSVVAAVSYVWRIQIIVQDGRMQLTQKTTEKNPIFPKTTSPSSSSSLPSVMDLEHFIESFLARLSNHDPKFPPGLLPFLAEVTTPDRLVNVLDFCSILMSIVKLSSSQITALLLRLGWWGYERQTPAANNKTPCSINQASASNLASTRDYILLSRRTQTYAAADDIFRPASAAADSLNDGSTDERSWFLFFTALL
jgi:hypothetical protein